MIENVYHLCIFVIYKATRCGLNGCLLDHSNNFIQKAIVILILKL